MENKQNQFDPLLKKLEDLGTNTIEIWRLKAIHKGVILGSALISNTVAMLFLMIGILFLSIGAALFIGSVMPAMYYGFAIVSLFYLLVFLVLIIFSTSIKQNLANVLTKAIFN